MPQQQRLCHPLHWPLAACSATAVLWCACQCAVVFWGPIKGAAPSMLLPITMHGGTDPPQPPALLHRCGAVVLMTAQPSVHKAQPCCKRNDTIMCCQPQPIHRMWELCPVELLLFELSSWVHDNDAVQQVQPLGEVWSVIRTREVASNIRHCAAQHVYRLVKRRGRSALRVP